MGTVRHPRRIRATRRRFAGRNLYPQQRGEFATASQWLPNPFIGVPDPTFTGWYIESSWFFGGHKTYEDEGTWGRPKINNPMFHGSGGWGGLQIVGKYDVLEMSDVGTLVPAGFQGNASTLNFVGACALTTLYPGVTTVSTAAVTNPPAGRLAECGDMKTWIVGVNWWMTPYMRLMFQYSNRSQRLSHHAGTTGTGTNLPAPKNGFDDATIRGFGMRASRLVNTGKAELSPLRSQTAAPCKGRRFFLKKPDNRCCHREAITR